MNSLPKTITRKRRGCDSNPGPSAPQPLGYRATLIYMYTIRAYILLALPERCPSVRLFVRLSHSPAEAACGGFVAAVGPAGRRYRSTAARPAPHQHGAAARRAAVDAGSATLSADEGS